MRREKLFGGMLFCLFALAVPLGIFAAEGKDPGVPSKSNENEKSDAQVVVLATTGIYDAKIVQQEKNVFTVSFELSNRIGVQPDVHYGVRLMSVGNEPVVIDEFLEPRSFTLEPDTALNQTLVYNAPEYLSGTFRLELFAQTSTGLPLSSNSMGEVSLSGSGQYIEIVPGTCSLAVDGESSGKKYTLRQGVDIQQGERLSLSCDISNRTDAPVSLTPTYQTFFRTTAGSEVSEVSPGNVSPFSLNAGEKRMISLAIPLSRSPQAYDIRVSFSSNPEVSVGSVVAHYVLRGGSATIQSVLFDETAYVSGDTASVIVSWSGPADDFIGARVRKPASIDGSSFVFNLSDGENACADEISVPVDAKSPQQTLSIPISRDCPSPRASVVLRDKNGVLLAEYKANLNSNSAYENTEREDEGAVMPPQGERKTSPLQMILFAALGISAALLFVLGWKRAWKTGRFYSFLFFLVAVGMFSSLPFGSKTAMADTFSIVRVNPNDSSDVYTMTFEANINKRIFAPGEGISAYLKLVSISCTNNGVGAVDAVISADINGTKKILDKAGNWVGGFTAPTVAGRFDAVFVIEQLRTRWGSGWIDLITGDPPYYIIHYNVIVRTLSVSKSGNGTGTVSSNPGGISCGADCTESYQNGTNVTLTAVANNDSTFTRWSGACTSAGSSSTCTVNMSANRSAGAIFTEKVLVSGRVYNGTTNASYAGKTLSVGGDCWGSGAQTVTTDSSGNYSFLVPPGQGYCAHLLPPSYPAGLEGPFLAPQKNQPVATTISYEWQVAGRNCVMQSGVCKCGSATMTENNWCEWDRSTDSGSNFRFTNPKKLLVCPSIFTISKNETRSLIARYWDSEPVGGATCSTPGTDVTTNVNTIWSSNSSAAKVGNADSNGAKGLVTGVSNGTADIKATYNGASATSGATVYACTGSIPATAESWGSSEETGLTSSPPWIFADSQHNSVKCEYKCKPGTIRVGNECRTCNICDPPVGTRCSDETYSDNCGYNNACRGTRDCHVKEVRP